MKMKISLIAALAGNGVIGKNNDLPWHLPADLKFFKKVTSGHHIIAGRKCFESFGKPLPGRTNIIITRQKDYRQEGAIVLHSLDEALLYAQNKGETEAFIIGGAEIYRQSLPLADQMYLTHIHHEFEGDTYFPEWDKSKWKRGNCEERSPDEKNKYALSFCVYKKIS